ncbi:MAG: hypothetical protein LBI63_04880 [Candidatus Ancillula sp.]|jgi:hypothetical protein|nr:hypothetical protein [Candidatus Ancillula sp.]
MDKILGYVKIARLDHWVKQLFILPGVVLAVALKSSHSASTVSPPPPRIFAS